MKDISEIISNHRLQVLQSGQDGFNAALVHPAYKPMQIIIVASWGGGWEHVSVSLRRRCPTWEEMCMVKDIFWGEDECVVQYHPPGSQKSTTYCQEVGMMYNNTDLRLRILSAGVRHYDVASAMGVTSETFSKWLRHELSHEKKMEVIQAIEKARNSK